MGAGNLSIFLQPSSGGSRIDLTFRPLAGVLGAVILMTLPSFCVSQTSGQGSERDPLRDPSREACFRPGGNGWPKWDPKSGPYFDSHLEPSEGPGLESPGEPHNTELNLRVSKMGP